MLRRNSFGFSPISKAVGVGKPDRTEIVKRVKLTKSAIKIEITDEMW